MPLLELRMLQSQILKLKDGRKLGFIEYGDPKGKPIFYFHGWPESRLLGSGTNATAKRLQVRIISIDRPGFGLSDFKEKRSLLDWPADVCELADYLGIKKFSVMGVSCGGPYAAVTAYKIPNRVIKAGILVGLGPVDIKGNLDGMSLVKRIGWAKFQRFSFLRTFSALCSFIGFKYFAKFSFLISIDSKEDQEMIREWFLKNKNDNSTAEAFRTGIKGPAYDLKLYTAPWGFELKDIKVKTYLWYGAKDRNVSINMGKYYNSQIANSELFINPGGHLFIHKIEAEILEKLTT